MLWQDILRDLRQLLQERRDASASKSSLEERMAERLHAVWWVVDFRLEWPLAMICLEHRGDVSVFWCLIDTLMIRSVSLKILKYNLRAKSPRIV